MNVWNDTKKRVIIQFGKVVHSTWGCYQSDAIIISSYYCSGKHSCAISQKTLVWFRLCVYYFVPSMEKATTNPNKSAFWRVSDPQTLVQRTPTWSMSPYLIPHQLHIPPYISSGNQTWLARESTTYIYIIWWFSIFPAINLHLVTDFPWPDICLKYHFG